MAVFNGWRLTRTGILFVVGIIVLAGLIFGGIVLVRDRGEQARRDEAVKIAEQNLESQSEMATNDGEVNQGEVPVTTETETENEPATTSTTTTTATELPTTGPELSSAIIVTLLALSGAFYVTSRRAVRDL